MPTIRTAVCALVVLAAPAAVSAQDAGARWQLLDNPGGEAPNATRTGTDQGQAVFDVPGWGATEGGFVAQSGPWSGIRPVEGSVFLRPEAGGNAAIRQVVELAPPGVRLPTHVFCGAFLRTWKGKDRAELLLELVGVGGEVVANATTGPQADVEWRWHELRTAVPAGATHAVVTLRGERRDGKIADACFDGVVLETFGPGHPPGLADRAAKDLAEAIRAASVPAERRAILRALAGQGSRGEAILAGLADAPSDEVERRYVLQLLTLERARSAQDLLEKAVASSDPLTREVALGLLAETDRGVAVIARIARTSNDARVRSMALEALARRGDREAVRELQKIAKAGGADSTVSVLRAVAAAGVEADLVYRPLLAPYLDPDAEDGLRDAAMDTLAALGDARYLTHFVALAPSARSQWQLVAWAKKAARFDSADAFAAFLELLDDRVPHAEHALLEALPAMRVAAATEWAARYGVDHESPVVRLAAVRHLAAARGPIAAEGLRRACGDADRVVAREAVLGLAGFGAETVAEELARFVARGEGAVAAAALRALAGIANDRAVALATEVLGGHRHWEVRVAALEVLGRDAASHRQLLVAALADEVWQVRVAAARSLANVRTRDTIEVLLARMVMERGSARAFFADLLADLTGEHRGDDPEIWRRWWAIVGGDFVVPPKSAARAKDAPLAGGTTTYHGIPVRSDRLVFAIDLSGSMTAEIDGRTKLRVAKDELIGVLRKLRPPQRFGVVGFGTGVEAFEPQLLEATPDQVERAIGWVEKLTIRGSTNVFGALEVSLAFPDAEAVFLLTDGEPSVGTYVDTHEIRRVVRNLNAERMVRIHTIAVGGGKASRAFLEALAEENDGVFRAE